jgi:hypothetical protein
MNERIGSRWVCLINATLLRRIHVLHELIAKIIAFLWIVLHKTMISMLLLNKNTTLKHSTEDSNHTGASLLGHNEARLSPFFGFLSDGRIDQDGIRRNFTTSPIPIGDARRRIVALSIVLDMKLQIHALLLSAFECHRFARITAFLLTAHSSFDTRVHSVRWFEVGNLKRSDVWLSWPTVALFGWVGIPCLHSVKSYVQVHAVRCLFQIQIKPCFHFSKSMPCRSEGIRPTLKVRNMPTRKWTSGTCLLVLGLVIAHWVFLGTVGLWARHLSIFFLVVWPSSGNCYCPLGFPRHRGTLSKPCVHCFSSLCGLVLGLVIAHLVFLGTVGSWARHVSIVFPRCVAWFWDLLLPIGFSSAPWVLEQDMCPFVFPCFVAWFWDLLLPVGFSSAPWDFEQDTCPFFSSLCGLVLGHRFWTSISPLRHPDSPGS